MKNESYNGYTSHTVIMDGRKVEGKIPPHKGICKSCGIEFYCTYKGKKYCSMTCYTSSPEFKERIIAQANKINEKKMAEAGFEHHRGRLQKPCLQCGKLFYTKPKEYHAAKYCSRLCYRAFMADRFDRYVANPESIALPQCYDEFLTQDELPCLIEGCGWKGQNLATHINFTHGILVQNLKKAAGFNKKTGLVTPELSAKLAKGKEGVVIPRPENFKRGEVPRQEIRLEGREHLHKARELIKIVQTTVMLIGKCNWCGKDYEYGKGTASKYCSIKCRSAYYNRKAYQLKCKQCDVLFLGDSRQLRMHEKGKDIFCSKRCSNARNSTLRRGKKG